MREWWDAVWDVWQSLHAELDEIAEGSRNRVLLGLGFGRSRTVFGGLLLLRSRAGRYWAQMPQENVEVVRTLWAGLERGDVQLDLCDERIELRTAAEIPVADEYRGHDGVRQWVTDVWEVFSEFHNEVEEVIEGETETPS